MSNSKPNKSFKALRREMQQVSQSANQSLLRWALRNLMLAEQQQKQFAGSGFVLPTAMLLLLVTSLVVGAMVFRTSQRTNSVIAGRQEQVIYNAATPAIDRAKAKLEVLFDKSKETRITGVVPAELDLRRALRNDGTGVAQKLDAGGNEFYTLPGETRLDIGNAQRPGTPVEPDNGPDNAWYYRTDLDGDGTDDATVAYSIIFEVPEDANNDGEIKDELAKLDDAAILARANALQVRTGPYSPNANANSACQGVDIPAGAPGWFPDVDDTSTLRKNFQVNAIVVPDGGGNNTISTLEFQQDRRFDRGNKWGAWFRNDLEIHPGPAFRWNGAMHTEGSLIVGNTSFTSFLVSSPASCLDIEESSTVSTTERIDPATETVSFQGQFLTGITADNNTGGGSVHHLFDANNPRNPIPQTLNSGSDSVSSGNPLDIALDPFILFSEDRNEARGGDPTTKSLRDGGWKDSDFVTRKRMKNDQEVQPFVDDTYRADNFYGPKPAYTQDVTLASEGAQLGDPIPAGNNILTNNNPGTLEEPQQIGLDGYWERRARIEGLKVIVSQRLELGNHFGWGFDGDEDGGLGGGSGSRLNASERDPLYPPASDTESTGLGSFSHEAQQRRKLRDNIAAVQSAAVYHYQVSEQGEAPGDYPVACLAATAHFATPRTIYNSVDFSQTNGQLSSDFFSGKGTNGWEYEAPDLAQITGGSTALNKAMENLAYFAGDPEGAFPPTQDNGGDLDHPYRYLRMWGNFSELRRIIDSGTAYGALSISDRTYIDTAACTLGMLARNVEQHQTYEYATAASDPSPQSTEIEDLGIKLFQVLRDNVTDYCPTGTAPNLTCDQLPTPAQLMYEADLTDAERALAMRILTKEQIERDRAFGFRWTTDTGNSSGSPLFNLEVDDTAGTDSSGNTYTFGVGCNVDAFGNDKQLSDFDSATPLALENNTNDTWKVGLALLCSAQPKYPALHYVFPAADHPHLGNTNGTYKADAGTLDATQPTTERYVSRPYIRDTTTAGYTYQALSDGDLTAMALQPRASSGDWVLPHKTVAADDPNIIIDPSGTPLAVTFLERVFFNGREMMPVRTMDIDLDQLRQEGPPVQTANPLNPYDFYVFSAAENWLSVRGIVYAFREDGMREEGIARPAAAGNCGSGEPCGNNEDLNAPRDPDIATTGNRGITIKPVDYYADPERAPHGFRLLNGARVDRDSTPAGGPNVAETNIFGISFISDNPVYIQDHFNVHSTNGDVNNRLEEFTEILNAVDFGNFYDRNNLDTRFARPTTDTWRPSEILADAVTALSGDFCEGSAQDLYVTAGEANPTTSQRIRFDWYLGVAPSPRMPVPIRLSAGGCTARNGVSFLGAQQLENFAGGGQTAVGSGEWTWENPGDTQQISNNTGFTDLLERLEQTTSPIKLSPRGNPIYLKPLTTTPGDPPVYQEFRESGTNPNQDYYDITSQQRRNNGINNATPTQMNAIIVSGIVPSRQNQPYGGLHNFLRFIENWGGTGGAPLNFSGSFLQLSFSSYATGPFDLDAWNPGDPPTGGSAALPYYRPPARRWGYDVGLQYAPAGPIAERFVSSDAIRSEFYTEPAVNDPYVFNLCQAALAVAPTTGPAKTCPTP